MIYAFPDIPDRVERQLPLKQTVLDDHRAETRYQQAKSLELFYRRL